MVNASIIPATRLIFSAGITVEMASEPTLNSSKITNTERKIAF